MLYQRQSTAIRPLTTAHLAQTMTLMGLTAMELRQKIESELARNPALEIAQETRCPICRRIISVPGHCPVCSQPANQRGEEPIVYVSPREDFYPTGGSNYTADGLPEDETAADAEELPHYVLRQIAPELHPDDRMLAAHILTSLDEDGLLRTPLVEIARFNHVTLSHLNSVLSLIQHADPIGVGSTSPQQALLVQLDVLSESRKVPPLAFQAIEQGMDLLSRRQYMDLGRMLGVSTVQAREIAAFISENLNPYPARAHWGTVHHPSADNASVYTSPDILISVLNDDPDAALVVEVISPMAGRLRINNMFRKALNDAPEEKTEQWQNDIEQATLLIKCLQQRDHTIVRLMASLAHIQRTFILNGDAYLAPITRASMAEELEVHESTISRAVSNKAVQLPNGKIIPLSRFFDRSLHIRTALRQIVSEESRPLTDTQIARLLKQQGHSIARRTVAKYRAMEGILPAHLRTPARRANQPTLIVHG